MATDRRLARTAVAAALAAAVASQAPGPAAAKPAQAGVSAAVRGEVALTSVVSRETRRPESGEDVFLGDAVATGDESGMQLLLLDESVFTIGEESELVIDRYVYDPDRGAAELSASLLKGGLRFVSGGISRTQPENVELKLPAATIGVRGTIVSTLQTPEGAYVFLDGPAQDNSAFQREGLANVTAGGATVTLSRSGFATFVPTGGVPQAPFRPDPQLRALILGAVGGGDRAQEGAGEGSQTGGQTGGRTGGQSPAVGSPADTAGATQVAALETAAVQQALTATQTTGEDLDPDEETAAPTATSDLSIPDLVGFATIADLDSIGSGVGHFTGTGLFFQTFQGGTELAEPIVGTAELSAQIDFGARTVFGGNSAVRLQAGTIDYFEALDIDSFDDSSSGFAIFTDDNGSSSPLSGALFIYNTAERTAGYAIGVVEYSGSNGDQGIGSAGAARADGPSPGVN
jgi:hypothetical protein